MEVGEHSADSFELMLMDAAAMANGRKNVVGKGENEPLPRINDDDAKGARHLLDSFSIEGKGLDVKGVTPKKLKG